MSNFALFLMALVLIFGFYAAWSAQWLALGVAIFVLTVFAFNRKDF